MRLLTISATAILVSASLAFAGGSHLITKSSIGKGSLGQGRSAYKLAYGKPIRTEGLEGGLTRVVFPGHVDAYFNTGSNAGRYIVSAGAAFKTAKKIGPCSAASAVKKAYPAAVKVALAGSEYAYRLGPKLWFEIESGKVAAVALGADKAAAFIASNTIPCHS